MGRARSRDGAKGRHSFDDFANFPNVSRHCKSAVPAAGLSTFSKIRAESLQHKAGVKKDKESNLSLLQPNYPETHLNLRLDPGSFAPAAGGVSKRTELEAYLDTGVWRPGQWSVDHEKTDPITHFKHEGIRWGQDHLYRALQPKRSGYNSRAALQSWTWAQDPKVREVMNLYDETYTSHNQKYALDCNGVNRYNMRGPEDLLPAATNDYIKCDRPPRRSHILWNDKELMAYCMRLLPEESKRANTHADSSRMWDVMRDAEYIKTLEREVPDAGQVAEMMRKIKAMNASARPRARNESPPASDDEGERTDRREMYRKMRSSRSLPPERFRGRDACTDSSDTDPRRGAIPLSSSQLSPGISVSSSTPPESKVPTLSMASPSISCNNLPYRSATARDSSTAQAMPPSGKAQGSMSSRSLGSRRSTARSEASLSMASVSITNAALAARSAAKNSTSRNSGPRSSIRS